jgi:multidrug efflux pump subunit AcrB
MTVLFSTIGVFSGLAIFNMDFVIIMTGIGIVSLAGIVVNNAIVLIDYIDLVKSRTRKEMNLTSEAVLDSKTAIACIQEGGQKRLKPVLLTAITTILGLLPLATGMNINFYSLLTEFNPQIFFGGDNALFWGPMAWTVIFGLSFATFLTLILVPVMYLLADKIVHKLSKLVS